MRLIAELPELSTKINQGELSLTILGLAHSHFRQEKKSKTGGLSKKEKLEMLDQISSFSVREAQRFLCTKSSFPKNSTPDQTMVLSDNTTEYRFTANTSLDKKIQELKGLLAHKFPNASLSEILEFACDVGLEKLKNPAKNSVAHMKRGATESVAQIRRDLRHKGQHCCSNCHSVYAIEIDHIKPRARGGKDTKDNLRLLCKSCNQRAAIQHFGVKVMDRYLSG